MTSLTTIHKNVNFVTPKNALSRIFKRQMKSFEKVFETFENQVFLISKERINTNGGKEQRTQREGGRASRDKKYKPSESIIGKKFCSHEFLKKHNLKE